jgi:hypothetical protein
MSKAKTEFVYSSWHLWNVAADSAQHSREVKASHPRACTTDTISALLLSAMSTEAFINELGTRLSLLSAYNGKNLGRSANIGTFLEQLEAEHAQIKSKYLLVSNLLPGKPFVKGKPPFQDFSLLIDIRNDFAHLKVQRDAPKYIRSFSQKGWLYNKKKDKPKLVGWMFQLETPEVSAWACRTARTIIWDIVARFQTVTNPLLKKLHDEMASQWKKSLHDKRIEL